jgi:hypothetical protein
MDCAGMPLTAARRANSGGIESIGNLAKGREPKWIARLVGLVPILCVLDVFREP